MTRIICNIQPGLLYQNIIIEGQKYSKKSTIENFSLMLDDIPEFLAKQQDINEIYIGGTSKEFLKPLEEKTKEIEQSLYSKNIKTFYYF